MTTSKGFQYNLAYTGSEADGQKRSIYSYSLRGVTYEVRAKVKAVAAPLINIASELSMVTPDADHITSSATMNGGYEVTLTDIKDEEGVVPYIIIDGGSPQVYDKNKHYYALSTVRTYCTYNDEGKPAQTGDREAACRHTLIQQASRLRHSSIRKASLMAEQDRARQSLPLPTTQRRTRCTSDWLTSSTSLTTTSLPLTAMLTP